ncbi:MAG: D-glycero-beta-D-manno-heptose 1-phosphate adenylyltransferase [Bacteroidales bacterium]|nr:D-glycero-beta-D-manno-heptose 1-phosphate adenylyltransferase [Bacteroidales bacterium]
MNKLISIKNKIEKDKAELLRKLNIYRFQDKKIVFTNGCFDILHRGHVEYLAQAASLGAILIIGLNSDDSVARLKGKNRPVQDEEGRAVVLAGLSFVNHIVLFDEDTPFELIKEIKPDILVKGSDYKEEDIIGADIVKKNGGKVVTIDFIDGYSTSKIIEKACK